MSGNESEEIILSDDEVESTSQSNNQSNSQSNSQLSSQSTSQLNSNQSTNRPPRRGAQAILERSLPPSRRATNQPTSQSPVQTSQPSQQASHTVVDESPVRLKRRRVDADQPINQSTESAVSKPNNRANNQSVNQSIKTALKPQSKAAIKMMPDRPRRSTGSIDQSTNQSDAFSFDQSSQSTDQSTEQQLSQPVKRGPGRPRLRPLSEGEIIKKQGEVIKKQAVVNTQSVSQPNKSQKPAGTQSNGRSSNQTSEVENDEDQPIRRSTRTRLSTESINESDNESAVESEEEPVKRTRIRKPANQSTNASTDQSANRRSSGRARSAVDYTGQSIDYAIEAMMKKDTKKAGEPAKKSAKSRKKSIDDFSDSDEELRRAIELSKQEFMLTDDEDQHLNQSTNTSMETDDDTPLNEAIAQSKRQAISQSKKASNQSKTRAAKQPVKRAAKRSANQSNDYSEDQSTDESDNQSNDEPSDDLMDEDDGSIPAPDEQPSKPTNKKSTPQSTNPSVDPSIQQAADELEGQVESFLGLRRIFLDRSTSSSKNDFIEQLLVKFKGKGHVHDEWIDKRVVNAMQPMVQGQLTRYLNKLRKERLTYIDPSINPLDQAIEESGYHSISQSHSQTSGQPKNKSSSQANSQPVKPPVQSRFERMSQEFSQAQHFDPNWLKVDRVISHRIKNKKESTNDSPHEWDKMFFLVKWCGLEYTNCTWETRQAIEDDTAIEKYFQRNDPFFNHAIIHSTSTSKDDSTNSQMSCSINQIIHPSLRLVRDKKSINQRIQNLQFKNSRALREYQVDGVNWLVYNLSNNRPSLLADEMGLGKTAQSIGVLWYLFTYNMLNASPIRPLSSSSSASHHANSLANQPPGDRGPFLVVAPLSTVNHWQREIETFTNMNAVIYHGTAESRRVIEKYEFLFDKHSVTESTGQSKKSNQATSQAIKNMYKFHVLIVPESIARTEQKILKSINWRLVVVDEGHRLKNENSQLANALMDVKCYQRILLTGTPIQNNMGELWAVLNYLDPDKFDDRSVFLEKYGHLSDNTSGNPSTESKSNGSSINDSIDTLERLISPYILRRMKEDVEKSLPPRTETMIQVELTKAQKVHYQLLYEKNVRVLHRAKASDLPSLNNLQIQLRKCCQHPWLLNGVEDEMCERARLSVNRESDHPAILKLMCESSGKLILLSKFLPKLRSEGSKVLIFSQMTTCLNIIQDACGYWDYPVERIDGSITGEDRQSAIDRFNSDPRSFVFLLSTKAGGLGLNLQAASTIIIFDSDWNPQNDLQAIARSHRIGQKKEVHVYRLIAKNTYENAMFERASMKLGLGEVVMGSINQPTNPSANQTIKKADLEIMLRKGFYAAQESESTELTDMNIDSILAKAITQTTTQVSTLPKSQSDGTSTDQAAQPSNRFATASYALNDDQLTDADFWMKAMPQAADASTNASGTPTVEWLDPAIIIGKRKRTTRFSATQLNRTLGQNKRSKKFVFDSDSEGWSPSNDSDSSLETAISQSINESNEPTPPSLKRNKSKSSSKDKEKDEPSSVQQVVPGPPLTRSNPFERSSLLRNWFNVSFQAFGYGAWDRIKQFMIDESIIIAKSEAYLDSKKHQSLNSQVLALTEQDMFAYGLSQLKALMYKSKHRCLFREFTTQEGDPLVEQFVRIPPGELYMGYNEFDATTLWYCKQLADDSRWLIEDEQKRQAAMKPNKNSSSESIKTKSESSNDVTMKPTKQESTNQLPDQSAQAPDVSSDSKSPAVDMIKQMNDKLVVDQSNIQPTSSSASPSSSSPTNQSIVIDSNGVTVSTTHSANSPTDSSPVSSYVKPSYHIPYHVKHFVDLFDDIPFYQSFNDGMKPHLGRSSRAKALASINDLDRLYSLMLYVIGHNPHLKPSINLLNLDATPPVSDTSSVDSTKPKSPGQSASSSPIDPMAPWKPPVVEPLAQPVNQSINRSVYLPPVAILEKKELESRHKVFPWFDDVLDREFVKATYQLGVERWSDIAKDPRFPFCTLIGKPSRSSLINQSTITQAMPIQATIEQSMSTTTTSSTTEPPVTTSTDTSDKAKKSTKAIKEAIDQSVNRWPADKLCREHFWRLLRGVKRLLKKERIVVLTAKPVSGQSSSSHVTKASYHTPSVNLTKDTYPSSFYNHPNNQSINLSSPPSHSNMSINESISHSIRQARADSFTEILRGLDQSNRTIHQTNHQSINQSINQPIDLMSSQSSSMSSPSPPLEDTRKMDARFAALFSQQQAMTHSNQSINQSLNQSIDNSLSRTIDSLNALTSGSNKSSTKPSTTQSISQSINQSINQKEKETKTKKSSKRKSIINHLNDMVVLPSTINQSINQSLTTNQSPAKRSKPSNNQSINQSIKPSFTDPSQRTMEGFFTRTRTQHNFSPSMKPASSPSISSINQSINQSISPLIKPSINQSINQSPLNFDDDTELGAAIKNTMEEDNQSINHRESNQSINHRPSSDDELLSDISQTTNSQTNKSPVNPSTSANQPISPSTNPSNSTNQSINQSTSSPANEGSPSDDELITGLAKKQTKRKRRSTNQSISRSPDTNRMTDENDVKQSKTTHSTNQSTNQSINQSINQSTSQKVDDDDDVIVIE